MPIPPYPASRPLIMADKPLLDRLCSETQPLISELSFAGLYLFRNAHEYRISKVAGSTVILGKGYDGTKYFLPPLCGNVPEALRIMFADEMPLYGADELFIKKHLTAKNLRITELRDSCDYLYLREELATLPGSRFHKKKNRINYFTSRHDYRVELFSAGHLNGCLKTLDKCMRDPFGKNERSLFMEADATRMALEQAEALGLEGVVIITDGTVAAFALGERLNRDTAVCHFEKAEPFKEGLYQLINREFARELFQECQYLNREQDLGDMGLRSAKLSYHPLELIKKYLVTML